MDPFINNNSGDQTLPALPTGDDDITPEVSENFVDIPSLWGDSNSSNAAYFDLQTLMGDHKPTSFLNSLNHDKVTIKQERPDIEDRNCVHSPTEDMEPHHLNLDRDDTEEKEIKSETCPLPPFQFITNGNNVRIPYMNSEECFPLPIKRESTGPSRTTRQRKRKSPPGPSPKFLNILQQPNKKPRVKRPDVPLYLKT